MYKQSVYYIVDGVNTHWALKAIEGNDANL